MSIIVSCNAPCNYVTNNSNCEICTDEYPDYDCPYCEVDEIDNDDIYDDGFDLQ